MGMNGAKGRAREMRKINNARLREAAAAGVDVSDRSAVAEFERGQWNAMIDRMFPSKSNAERAAMKR